MEGPAPLPLCPASALWDLIGNFFPFRAGAGAARGVAWYVVDSVDELRRVHEIGADAKTYLRVATPNIGSDWPLSGKFGAGAGEAREIIQTAAKLGADLAGVTFHACSQCRLLFCETHVTEHDVKDTSVLPVRKVRTLVCAHCLERRKIWE